jgi:hypothetical protein
MTTPATPAQAAPAQPAPAQEPAAKPASADDQKPDDVTAEKTEQEEDSTPEPAMASDPAAQPPHASASNESPTLPVSAQSSAAKAHAVLSHFRSVIDVMIRDIERVVPHGMMMAARDEVSSEIRKTL